MSFSCSHTNKSRLAVDWGFMYIGSAGPARRTGGRTGGGRTILNDSTTIFIDFHKKHPKTLRFSVVSRPAGAQVPIFIAKMKNASKKDAKSIGFLTFRNRRSRKYRFLLFKNQFLGASADPADPADPPDPPEMEHELRLATHQQRAGGQDDGSLNKLPQIRRKNPPGPIWGNLRPFFPWTRKMHRK